jgi:outer membrane protein TolC
LAALGDEAALARFPLAEGTESGVDAERDGEWSVGPAVSTPVPLFDWGQQRRAKARAQRVEARHRLTEARRAIVEDVRRALETLESARATLRQVQAELVPLSEQRVRLAEDSHRNGLADLTVLLLAQQEALDARLKLIETRSNASSALAKLYRAVGGPGAAAQVRPAPNLAATSPTSAPSK